MTTRCFSKSSRIPATASDVYRWHEQPGALVRLTPPWEDVSVVRRSGGLEAGSEVELSTRVGPLRLTWLAEHVECEPGEYFRDVQRKGPFALWDHRHTMKPDGEGASTLQDAVTYRLPLGFLGNLFGGPFVARKLKRMFDYRHRVLTSDIERHRAYGPCEPLQIAVTGSSGMLGSQLTGFLSTGGHAVTRLVRSETQEANAVRWDTDFDPQRLDGADAVVHLAGENIGGKRWSAEQKKRIRESRVVGTRHLCERLAKAAHPPKVFVCASAVGFYGSRGDEVLNEESASGTGFLADVCREWEDACEPLRAVGTRVVHVRFGVILSPAGGALAKMLTPFLMGVGGRIGSGEQFMSWVSVDDAVGAIHHAIRTESLEGPVNVVAPQPVTNAEYTRELGRVLRRPTILPMPAFAARLAFGEMADELLLASTRAVPEKLVASGYRFEHPQLSEALAHLLGRSPQ